MSLKSHSTDSRTPLMDVLKASCSGFNTFSLLFSAKQQREITKFCVFWKILASMENILNFLMEWIAGITYLI